MFVADANVVASELERGAALLDLRSSRYFDLNPVGFFVWNEIQTPKTLDQLSDAVAGRFDISKSVCEADIVGLLDQLIAADLARDDG